MHTDVVMAPGDGTAASVMAGLRQHYDRGAQGAQEGKVGMVVH